MTVEEMVSIHWVDFYMDNIASAGIPFRLFMRSPEDIDGILREFRGTSSKPLSPIQLIRFHERLMDEGILRFEEIDLYG